MVPFATELMVWINLFCGSTTRLELCPPGCVCAMAALLVCIRGIERDPCLGEWVGLRREAHADLMCV